MAIATVACPKCKKTFRSSDEVKGKRIRCPHCGVGFAVKEFAKSEARQDKPAASPAGEDDAANPYDVKTVAIVARCPNCANEMESETAVICLFCGYNTQTRTLGQTQRVIQTTGGDKFKWLMPGIACAVGILVLVALQNYYILGIGPKFRAEEDWMIAIFFSEPLFLWLTLILAAAIWLAGRFAYKRLILEPTPPEEQIE
jgi:DNA-directed RNA polymerase subunit RPC12/RpoP